MSASRLVSVVFAAVLAMISVNGSAIANNSGVAMAAVSASAVGNTCCNGTITSEDG